MHPHGVQIFNRTNDNTVIIAVPDHFHFIFFPTDDAFLDQKLIGRRSIKSTIADFIKLILVIGNPTTTPTQSE